MNPSASVVAYALSQDLVKYSSRLPSNPGRSLLVHSLAKSFGLLSPEYRAPRRIQVLKPKPATKDELAVYHAQDYLEIVLREEFGSDGVDSELVDFGLEHDCPRFTGLSEYIRFVAGATLTGANALRLGYADISINWDGGRHHAQKSRASGFCYVADCVLAVLLLRKAPPAPPMSNSAEPTSVSDTGPAMARHKKARVMYLDLDVHFSDGVSEAFYAPVSSTSGQVLTLSIHHAAPGFFPASPLAQLPFDSSTSFDPFALSLPLLEGASNRTYAAIWPIVERIKDIFEPNYVVVQCGVDGLAGDPKCKVFNWSLDVQDEGSLGWCVSRIVNNWNCKKTVSWWWRVPLTECSTGLEPSHVHYRKPIHVSTNIPDHPSHSGFPLYGPSFTLDIPAGNMHDANTEEYLAEVSRRFDLACNMLQERVVPLKADTALSTE